MLNSITILFLGGDHSTIKMTRINEDDCEQNEQPSSATTPNMSQSFLEKISSPLAPTANYSFFGIILIFVVFIILIIFKIDGADKMMMDFLYLQIKSSNKSMF